MSDPEVERAAEYLATHVLMLLGVGTLAAAISIACDRVSDGSLADAPVWYVTA